MPSRKKTAGTPIDWKKAIAPGTPSEDFLEGKDLDDPGDLEAAFEDFIYSLKDGYFLRWEAVIREEQGLPLSNLHDRTLDDLISFNEEDDERILYINECPRPTEPWFEIARKIARCLVLEEAFHTDVSHYEVVTCGRPKLVDALEKHAAGLSLPEGAKTAIDIIPAEVQHRLWLQSSFDALSGIGQSFGRGEHISLESPEQLKRVDRFLKLLREHKASVEFLGLTLEELFRLLVLPKKDAGILARMLSGKLGLRSSQDRIADVL
jgi:hypothetical protein